MATGECNCGAVAFKIEAQLSDVFICHCSICRRSTGSGGIAVSIVDNDSFSWIRGKGNIKYWSKPGHDWHTSFCSNCGSPLPGKNNESNMYVPVGTLTSGDEKLKIAHHIWINSKADWEEICGSGKQHSEGFGD
ncbi:GFA family protein [Exilibacterium tricleocarpae]|uniref:GFA family protein n=1 Tax=Exilibacterium tricleocarpae TaxID=2591008 RepID=A0A545TAN4_9GAMM|nr:GFA family protein [Exilibacterium tricleocarpae]TQV74280.1 GFA family protein [Exilibacterium tricleocarpae]